MLSVLILGPEFAKTSDWVSVVNLLMLIYGAPQKRCYQGTLDTNVNRRRNDRHVLRGCRQLVRAELLYMLRDYTQTCNNPEYLVLTYAWCD